MGQVKRQAMADRQAGVKHSGRPASPTAKRTYIDQSGSPVKTSKFVDRLRMFPDGLLVLATLARLRNRIL